jgi:hypothetical protein
MRYVRQQLNCAISLHCVVGARGAATDGAEGLQKLRGQSARAVGADEGTVAEETAAAGEAEAGLVAEGAKRDQWAPALAGEEMTLGKETGTAQEAEAEPLAAETPVGEEAGIAGVGVESGEVAETWVTVEMGTEEKQQDSLSCRQYTCTARQDLRWLRGSRQCTHSRFRRACVPWTSIPEGSVTAQTPGGPPGTDWRL